MEFWFINKTGNKTFEKPSYMCPVLPLLLFFLLKLRSFFGSWSLADWIAGFVLQDGYREIREWDEPNAWQGCTVTLDTDGCKWKPFWLCFLRLCTDILRWLAMAHSQTCFGVLFGSSHLTVIMWHHCVTTGTLGTEICLAATCFVENLAGHGAAMLVVCVLHVTSLRSLLHYTISSWRQISLCDWHEIQGFGALLSGWRQQDNWFE